MRWEITIWIQVAKLRICHIWTQGSSQRVKRTSWPRRGRAKKENQHIVLKMCQTTIARTDPRTCLKMPIIILKIKNQISKIEKWGSNTPQGAFVSYLGPVVRSRARVSHASESRWIENSQEHHDKWKKTKGVRLATCGLEDAVGRRIEAVWRTFTIWRLTRSIPSFWVSI